MRDQPERGEEHKDDLQGESDGTQLIDTIDTMETDSEAQNEFWSIEGNYIYRHRVEPRVLLYVPQEEPLTLPLRYMDAIRDCFGCVAVKPYR